MSFFGMFGSGSGKDEDKKSCECNEQLKEHLKKCAGYGQRPPLIENCAVSGSNPCQDNLGGPPSCKGRTEAPPKCCPPPAAKKPEPFVPKCEVPPALTFKCPDSTCEEVKPKCEQVKVEPQCEEKPACAPPKVEANSCCGGGSKSSKASNDNSCEPRPLKM